MPRPLRTLVLGLILAALVMLLFIRLVAAPDALIADSERAYVDLAYPGQARGIGNDLTFVFLPRFLAIVNHLQLHHTIPTWDPSGFAGRPLVGNPQAGLFYPPVWLAWMSGRPSALGWLTVAHLIWAGIGTFALARQLRLARVAALTAAACFEASPYLLAHVSEGHYPHVWSVCWYPWAFRAMLLVRKGCARGTLELAAILALAFLAGHPQEWYNLIVVLAIWAIAEGLTRIRTQGVGAGVHWLGLWLGALALSLALCAIELLPDVAAHPWTLRPDPNPGRQIDRYHLHALNLAQLLTPSALGAPHEYFGHDNYWETVFSAGLATLVLAAIGVARHARRTTVRSWLLLAILASVFAGGRKLGLCAIAYRVLPGMEQFRVPSRTLFLASLAVAILAGFGADALRSRALSGRDWKSIRRRVLGALAIVATGVASLALLSEHTQTLPVRADMSGSAGGRPSTTTSTEPQHAKDRAILTVNAIAGDGIFWATIVGVTFAWTAFGGGVSGRKRTSASLAALAVVELVLRAQALLVVAPIESFVKPDSAGSRLEPLLVEPTGPFRAAAVGALLSDLDAAEHGLEKANVNDGFQLRHAAMLYERLYTILDPIPRTPTGDQPMDRAVQEFDARVARSVLERMSVRYLVTNRAVPFEDVERVEPDIDRDVQTYRIPSALPRAYVVPRARVFREKVPAIANTLANVDPLQVVLLPIDPLAGLPGDRQAFTLAEWRSARAGSATVHVETRGPGLLVLVDTWMPGWTATVDGRDEPVLRGNHFQQVVPLRSAGQHEVTLEFEPPQWKTGIALTVCAIVAWAVLYVCTLRVRRPRRVTLGA